MRNPLTIHIETRVGAVIVLVCAVLSFAVVMRAISNFASFLVLLHAQTPITKTVVRVEHDRMNRWLKEQGLNMYGDAPETVYEKGTPLWDEEEGAPIDPVRGREGSQRASASNGVDRYAFLMRKFPDKPWRTK